MMPGPVFRVLLVEDEMNVRRLMTRCLIRAGFEVLEHDRPEAALRSVRALREVAASSAERPFDILVTDVVMPGMSGPQLAQHVEALWSGVLVLFVSGFASEDLASYGMDASMPLLRKPFSGRDLVCRLRTLLEAGSVGGADAREAMDRS